VRIIPPPHLQAELRRLNGLFALVCLGKRDQALHEAEIAPVWAEFKRWAAL
jgi:hypothetical protein